MRRTADLPEYFCGGRTCTVDSRNGKNLFSRRGDLIFVAATLYKGNCQVLFSGIFFCSVLRSALKNRDRRCDRVYSVSNCGRKRRESLRGESYGLKSKRKNVRRGAGRRERACIKFRALRKINNRKEGKRWKRKNTDAREGYWAFTGWEGDLFLRI